MMANLWRLQEGSVYIQLMQYRHSACCSLIHEENGTSVEDMEILSSM